MSRGPHHKYNEYSEVSNMNAKPKEGSHLQNLEGKGVKIIINNITGFDKNNRKLERIIETMSSNEIDIFPGTGDKYQNKG